MKIICKHRVQFRNRLFKPGDIVDISEGEYVGNVVGSFVKESKADRAKAEADEADEVPAPGDVGRDFYKQKLTELKVPFHANAPLSKLRALYEDTMALAPGVGGDL